MKKLGLIGGMGPESTIPYYHDIIMYGVQEKVGAGYFPCLTIEVSTVHCLDTRVIRMRTLIDMIVD